MSPSEPLPEARRHPPFRTGPWWSWLPLPFCAVALVLLWVLNPGTAQEDPHLVLPLTLLFLTAVPVVSAYLCGQAFLADGQPGMLLRGCGLLAWGAGSGLALVGGLDANLVVTGYNLGIWAFSLCQLIGTLLLVRPAGSVSSPGRWLAAGYPATLAVLVLVVATAHTGRFPVFFVQGYGGTLVRQVVLGSALLMLYVTTALLWQVHQRVPSPFHYGFALGLTLLGLGLIGTLIQTSTGSVLNWVGSTAQYLGGLYLLAATLVRTRTPEPRPAPRWEAELPGPSPGRWILRYGMALLAPAAAFAAHHALTSWAGGNLSTYVLFYPAVFLVAIQAGPGPGLLATLASVLLAGIWILPSTGHPGLLLLPERLGVVLFSVLGLFLSVFAHLYQWNRRRLAIYDQEATLREVRRDKEFLAGILERASQPFAVSYPDGRLGLFNQAFERLTGYSAEELHSLSWSGTLTPPEWWKAESRMLEELHRSGEPVRYEKEFLTKHGRRIPVELLVHLAPATMNQAEYYYSFVTDITERRQSESLLQRYELLAQHTRDIVMFVDRRTGRILEANTAASIAYDRPREELLELTVQDLRAPGSRGLTTEQMDEADTQGILFETIHQRKDGDTFPVEVSSLGATIGGVRMLLSVIRDVGRRKHWETILLESERQFRAIFEVASVGLVQVNLDDGRLLRFNEKYQEITGYGPEELLRQRLPELTHLEDRQRDEREMARAIRGEIPTYRQELRYLRKDGTVIWVRLNAAFLRDGDGTAHRAVLVCEDITERKGAERALQENEATLRAILDATQESILLFDEDGTILAANHTALKRLGKPPSEVLGTSFSRYLSPETAVARAARLAEVLETGLPVNFEDERRGVIFDHTFYPVIAPEGQVRRVAVYSRDITETRRVEAALRRTTARQQLLAESSRELLGSEDPRPELEALCGKVMDFLDCQVFLNHLVDGEDGALRLNAWAGLSPVDVRRFQRLPAVESSGEDPATSLAIDLEAGLAQSCGIQAFACTPLRIQGTLLGTLAFGARNRARFTAEELSLMGALADQVSLALQRVQAKRALHRMNADLERANATLERRVVERTLQLQERMLQLRALAGRLNRAEDDERRRIARIIHDHLLQLLVAARFSLDAAGAHLKEQPGEQALESIAGIISKSIQISRALTAELYPSVLYQEGLAAALEWLAEWYHGQHGLSVQVEIDHQADVPEPSMRVMLFRAVRELLLNVVKHASVNAATVRLDHPGAGTVRIAVRDEGKGFDVVDVRAGEGMFGGFGLFGLRERLEFCGGRLDVESAPGQGSRFTITAPLVLPLLETPARAVPANGAGRRLGPGASRAKVRIIVADDHMVVREGLVQLLKEEADFEIVGQAANGLEALETAQRLHPDVVVMDVSMPVMNGIDATRRIKEELPAVKVIGLSMYNDESHAEVMRDAGAEDFLDKSGPISVMVAAIRRHTTTVAPE